jgi:hypothetical protein
MLDIRRREGGMESRLHKSAGKLNLRYRSTLLPTSSRLGSKHMQQTSAAACASDTVSQFGY